MQFNEYQSNALTTAKTTALSMDYLIPGLVAEAGEVAGHYAKYKRDGYLLVGDPQDAIVKELGDVLWFIAVIAFQYGLPMEKIAQINLDKLRSRAARGMIEGSGDDR